jgi:PHD/YefM family antitoxin component YafN of YafNO toxin-antitoxin module
MLIVVMKACFIRGLALIEVNLMTELLAVSAKDVAGKFGYYTDEAMLRPVGIQRHGTTRVVMISLNEYERLLRRDRQVLLTKDLDDETLNAILNAKASERSKALNHLLDDA